MVTDPVFFMFETSLCFINCYILLFLWLFFSILKMSESEEDSDSDRSNDFWWDDSFYLTLIGTH